MDAWGIMVVLIRRLGWRPLWPGPISTPGGRFRNPSGRFQTSRHYTQV